MNPEHHDPLLPAEASMPEAAPGAAPVAAPAPAAAPALDWQAPPVSAAEQARERLPPRIGALYSRFLGCDACQRLYWEGSHWRSMRAVLAPLLEAPPEE